MRPSSRGPAVATADEGRREINQACAALGCFPGDPAGFPVVITTPGSYVLTGNLGVQNLDSQGISIQIDGVLIIDLNGFEIKAGAASPCQGMSEVNSEP